MRARKKPVEIDYIVWNGANIDEVKEFCGDALKSEESNVHTMGYFLGTLEGHSYLLSKGDVIIKGVKGECYPCKPDIFEATYDIIQDGQ